MKTNHVVVWIDHREAHILFYDAAQNQLIKSEATTTHLHHKANTIGHGNAPEDVEFYKSVILKISEVSEILIIGPGSAKHEIVKYIASHYPKLSKCILGVETVDHITDNQILAYAKKYFLLKEKLKGI